MTSATPYKQRAALWLRVSKDVQETENQRPALESAVEARGLRIVKEWNFDGSAWRGDYKPELAELFKAAQRREFRWLIFWSLDRLCREGVTETLLIVRRLALSGVDVISVQEPWLEAAELDPQYRELLIAQLAWVANFESRRRSDRIKAGLSRKKAKGQPIGRKAGSRNKRLHVRRFASSTS